MTLIWPGGECLRPPMRSLVPEHLIHDHSLRNHERHPCTRAPRVARSVLSTPDIDGISLSVYVLRRLHWGLFRLSMNSVLVTSSQVPTVPLRHQLFETSIIHIFLALWVVCSSFVSHSFRGKIVWLNGHNSPGLKQQSEAILWRKLRSVLDSTWTLLAKET